MCVRLPKKAAHIILGHSFGYNNASNIDGINMCSETQQQKQRQQQQATEKATAKR